MKIATLGAAALVLALAAPAAAQLAPPISGRDITSGPATGSAQDAPGGMRYSTDGNAKTPREVENPNVPAYQRGSGQDTGGPARELIPPSR